MQRMPGLLVTTKTVGSKIITGLEVLKFTLIQRVSDQLSAAMYNQTLPHGAEAMAETWEYHRNVAWTQVSWHSKSHLLFTLRAMQVTV